MSEAKDDARLVERGDIERVLELLAWEEHDGDVCVNCACYTNQHEPGCDVPELRERLLAAIGTQAPALPDARDAREEGCRRGLEAVAAKIEHDERSLAGDQPLRDCGLPDAIRALDAAAIGAAGSGGDEAASGRPAQPVGHAPNVAGVSQAATPSPPAPDYRAEALAWRAWDKTQGGLEQWGGGPCPPDKVHKCDDREWCDAMRAVVDARAANEAAERAEEPKR